MRGRLPRNERGNWEVWSPRHIPQVTYPLDMVTHQAMHPLDMLKQQIRRDLPLKAFRSNCKLYSAICP